MQTARNSRPSSPTLELMMESIESAPIEDLSLRDTQNIGILGDVQDPGTEPFQDTPHNPAYMEIDSEGPSVAMPLDINSLNMEYIGPTSLDPSILTVPNAFLDGDLDFRGMDVSGFEDFTMLDSLETPGHIPISGSSYMANSKQSGMSGGTDWEVSGDASQGVGTQLGQLLMPEDSSSSQGNASFNPSTHQYGFVLGGHTDLTQSTLNPFITTPTDRGATTYPYEIQHDETTAGTSSAPAVTQRQYASILPKPKPMSPVSTPQGVFNRQNSRDMATQYRYAESCGHGTGSSVVLGKRARSQSPYMRETGIPESYLYAVDFGTVEDQNQRAKRPKTSKTAKACLRCQFEKKRCSGENPCKRCRGQVIERAVRRRLTTTVMWRRCVSSDLEDLNPFSGLLQFAMYDPSPQKTKLFFATPTVIRTFHRTIQRVDQTVEGTILSSSIFELLGLSLFRVVFQRPATHDLTWLQMAKGLTGTPLKPHASSTETCGPISAARIFALTTLSWDTFTAAAARTGHVLEMQFCGIAAAMYFFAETTRLLSLAKKPPEFTSDQRATLCENLEALYVVALHGHLADEIFWRSLDIATQRTLAWKGLLERPDSMASRDAALIREYEAIAESSKQPEAEEARAYRYADGSDPSWALVEYAQHWLHKLGGNDHPGFASTLHLIRLNTLCRLDMSKPADKAPMPFLDYIYPEEKIAPRLKFLDQIGHLESHKGVLADLLDAIIHTTVNATGEVARYNLRNMVSLRTLIKVISWLWGPCTDSKDSRNLRSAEEQLMSYFKVEEDLRNEDRFTSEDEFFENDTDSDEE